MLAYEAYFDALEPLHTSTDAWKSIMAGLVVLRLVEDWLDHGAPAVAHNPASVLSVREAVARLRDQDPVRPILCELVNIITQAEEAAVQAIAAPVLEYGQILHFTNRWTLSRDVYASLLKWGGLARDQPTIARAARHLGFVLRNLGQLDASDSIYAIALQTSSSATEQHSISLKAKTGMALNLIFRNRLAEAHTAFREIAAEAQSLGLADHVSEALEGISSVAFAQKDYYASIKAYKKAIMHHSNPLEKDRQRISLAGALVGYGDHDAAKKILIPLQTGAQPVNVCQTALINLLEIAAKERDKRAFEYYRGELHNKLSVPELQVHHHLYLGKGYQGFWQPAAAMKERQIALDIATEYGLHHLRALILDEIRDTAAKGPSARLR